MPDHTCPHLAPIGGWCRLGTNFKCPAKANRVDCPYPNVGSLDQRASERKSVPAPSPIPFDHGRLFETLALPFAANELRWQTESLSRDRRRALVRPSLTQSSILERLDAVVGAGGWSERYESVEGGIKCSLTVLGVVKESIESNAALDQRERSTQAFMRAASKFGMGRYLEKLESTWVDFDDETQQPLETPALPDWALPITTQNKPEVRLTRFVPPAVRPQEPNTPEKPVPFNITRDQTAVSKLPTPDGNALLVDLMRSLRELPGGEAALRRIVRHNDLAKRSPEEKRKLYAELRRAHRELSSLQA